MILAVKQDNLELAALLLKQGGRSESEYKRSSRNDVFDLC
ncbi:hypothetical protein [Leptospira interrogans]